MLAATPAFDSPLFWAAFIGWILSVTLHEFAHGLVGLWGGDYTIRERGGLSLNPFQYMDPVGSLIFPAVIFLLGGIPLPGGVTYIRRDLLRGRGWDSAVSAAGPGMNILLFLILAIFLHPKVGWIDPFLPVQQWTQAQIFVATMAVLQLWAAILNLFPIPPLDGFGIIRPFLPEDIRFTLSQPAVAQMCFFVFFLLMWNVSAITNFIFRVMDTVASGVLALPFRQIYLAFRLGMFGEHW